MERGKKGLASIQRFESTVDVGGILEYMSVVTEHTHTCAKVCTNPHTNEWHSEVSIISVYI